MKFYEVECRAVIILAAQDMRKAASHGAAVIKKNLHLINVKAVRERNFEPAWEDLESRNPPRSQKAHSPHQAVQ
jgi:hypothetical protein